MNLYLSIYKKQIFGIFVLILLALLTYGLVITKATLYLLVFISIILTILGTRKLVKYANVPKAFRSFDLSIFFGTIYILCAIALLYKSFTMIL